MAHPYRKSSPVNQIKYGESRGEGHDVKKRFRYDPADKKAFEALSQVKKDSLQGEAYKYNKPFFSPKYGVNVDPEDGVLSNRPIYSDNTKLTYDKIDKPFSPVNIKEEAYEKQNKKMRADHKKDTGKTLGERQTSGTGSRRVSFACRFGGMAGDMTDDDGSPSKLAMALKKWGFSSKSEAKAFCSKNKES